MGTKLGFSGPFVHRDASDINYWRRWNPPSIKLFNVDWADTNNLQTFYTVFPNTLFTYRNWPQSEEHQDLFSNPVGTGIRHAAEWAQRVHQGKDGMQAWKTIPGWNAANNLFHGINEPHVWLNKAAVAAYYVAFLDELKRHGLRGAALNFSVGWPDNSGPNTAVNWGPYESVRAAIVRGNHVLCVHEYWDLQGHTQNLGWWVGRVRQCPWNVPILIGETGIDRGVISSNPADWNGTRGWSGHKNTEQYVAELAAYDRYIQGDRRIIAAQIFTYDYDNNHEWFSFGLQGIRANLTEYAERVRNDPLPPALPFPWYPPEVINPPETPVPPQDDTYRNRLFAAGQAAQVIRFNPSAGIQREMVRDGYVPNSPEFNFEGKVAQRGERLDNGAVRMYTWSASEGVKEYN